MLAAARRWPSDRPLKYGVNDCAQFVAFLLRELGAHYDAGDTSDGAAADRGAMAARVTRALGAPIAARPRTGDVVLWVIGDVAGLGMQCGRAVLTLSADGRHVTAVTRARIYLVWRPEECPA